jgi:hypothetical protein
MEEVVQCHHGHCSSHSLPAYYVLLVLFVTIFGLSCVGRRVTGALLVAVSLVAVVVAAVAAATQDCLDDAVVVEESIAHRLQQCGLFVVGHPAAATNGATTGHRHSNNTSALRDSAAGKAGGDHESMDAAFPVQFHRFHEQPASPHTQHCKELATNFDALCNASVTTGSHVTNALLGVCARHVTGKLRELCAQDREVVQPVLLTVPFFYVFIGVGYIVIKHTDNKLAAQRSKTVKTRSQGTNTATKKLPHSNSNASAASTSSSSLSSSSANTGPACRRLLASCLQALFTRWPCCLTCLLHGHQSAGCCSRRSRSGQSRQSYTHAAGPCEHGENDEALHMPLRTSLSSDRYDRRYLMEQCV